VEIECVEAPRAPWAGSGGEASWSAAYKSSLKTGVFNVSE
jgi:hypothetical protein